MAHRKGAPKTPGSGRKKGSRNKRTLALQTEIAASGEIPLDYMLRVMRDPRSPSLYVQDAPGVVRAQRDSALASQ